MSAYNHDAWERRVARKIAEAGLKQCECGCGAEIPAITKSLKPRRFVAGHWKRLNAATSLRHSNGYVLELDREHPKAHNGYAYQHLLVWEREHGPLPEGWQVHHRNGIKDDNRLENLEAMPQGDHRRLHLAEWGPDKLREWQRLAVEARRRNRAARECA